MSHTSIKKTTRKRIRKKPKGRVSESKPNAEMGTGFNSTSTPADIHRYVILQNNYMICLQLCVIIYSLTVVAYGGGFLILYNEKNMFSEEK